MPRTLLSALLAAALLAAGVTALVLFLNPDLQALREWRVLALLFLAYAGVGWAAFCALALLGRAFRWWPSRLRPPVPGLPWFTSLALTALLLLAALYWLNLLTYRYSIPEESVRALAAASLVLAGAALALVAVSIDALLFPFRSRRVSAAVVLTTVAVGGLVPPALRPRPVPRPPPVPLRTETIEPARRVVLIGIDGLSPELVRDGVSRGLLPSIARLMRRGASGPLATFRPTEGPPIWTTIFTGRFPRDHGIKSFSTYRLRGSEAPYDLLPKGALVGWLERAGVASRRPVSAASRKRRALWSVLNAFGIRSGIVRFWGTSPPERVQGFMLAHSFHLLLGDPARAVEALHPPDLIGEVRAQAVEPDGLDPATLAPFVDLSVELPGDRVPWRRELVERALAPDLTYERAGAVLRAAYDPPFFATYFYGLDVVGHTFLRHAQPDRFGDVSAGEVRRYGKVVDRYLSYLSQVVGEHAQALRPGEVLLVVSGYGMHPLPLWRRALSGLTGERGRSGTHDDAPDGFILAVGDGIKPDLAIQGASVLDVAPTILYLMGLPVARDMEGRVATEIVDDEFARSHPVTVIPSFESLAVTPALEPLDTNLPPLPEEAP